MDLVRIGGFLRQLRKEHGLTQEQLGEKVGATNKTISRWETGVYMPPVECLAMLSELYGVSINEIVAGKRVEMEGFADVAEDNITDALKSIEKSRAAFENRMMVILAITTVITIAIILMLPLESVKDVVVFVLVIALAFISNTMNMVSVALGKSRTWKDEE